MNNLLDQMGITKNGQLPTVNVQVQVDDKSVWKLSAAMGGAVLLVGLLLIIVSKYSK